MRSFRRFIGCCVCAAFFAHAYASDVLSERAEFLLSRPLFLHGTEPLYLRDLLDEQYTALLRHLFGEPKPAADAADGQSGAELSDAAIDDILSMLDNRAETALDAGESESGEQELYFSDQDDTLRRFSYGVEQFASYELNGRRFMTDSDGKKMVRRAYDEQMRLVQTETFALPSDVKNVTRDTVIVYRYQNDSITPFQMEKTDEKNKTRTLMTFNELSLPVHVEQYHSDAENEVLDKTIDKRYDEQKNVIRDERTEWTYTKDSKNRTQAKKLTVRYEYEHGKNGGAGHPDTLYYEDDVLRIKKVYENPVTYTEMLYFDGGFSVEALYEDYIKTREIIYLNGVEQRRRTFAY